MKWILAALVFSGGAVAAPQEKFENLEVGGVTYTNVVVNKVYPDGISIIHSDGAKTLKFSDLPKEISDQFGYDPVAAANFSKKREEARVAAEIAQVDQLQEKLESERKFKSDQEEKAFQEAVSKLARPVKVEAFDNARIGLIGEVYVGVVGQEPVRSRLGSVVGQKASWKFLPNPVEGVVKMKGQASIRTDEYGFKTILWEGFAWPLGTISYTTAQGITRECFYFSSVESEARKYYAKNGLPGKK